MDPILYQRATDIFTASLAHSPHEVDGFVAAECAGNKELEALVRRLLSNNDKPTFLDSPIAISDRTDEPGHEKDVLSVGQYRIDELIASGGMGAVYLARQANPDRRVAIKLLRVSDTYGRSRDGSLLERESHLLGRLQHKGIARIYEAGSAEIVYRDGRSGIGWYVAMEYIEGTVLDEYVRSRTIDKQSLVRIVLEIVEAIQHAHQRGVIHRDLKPSNILIDREGSPHIIDFGVALAFDAQDITQTSEQGVVGTVSYMAPEQIVGRLDQIDTRSDIYAIGAIAYELLTGEKLHRSAESFEDAILARLLRARPARSKSFERLAGRELAYVIARAAHPDRDMRYESAGALAADLRKVLSGHPVDAGSDSAIRTLRLYARRHTRVASILVAAITIASAGVFGMTFATIRATRSALIAQSATESATTKALHAERIATFLTSSLFGVDPEERGAQVSLFDAIDYAANRIHRDLADVPAVEADVRFDIGFVYRRHGRLAEALGQVRIAHRLREQLYGIDDPKTLESAEELGYLAWVYEGDMDGASLTLGSTLASLVRRGDGNSAMSGWVRIKLAVVRLALDDPVSAEALLETAEPIMVEQYGRVFAARTMRHRAVARAHMGRYDEAEAIAREALALCQGADEQEYIEARCRATLGYALWCVGQFSEARRELDLAVSQLVSFLPDDHPEIGDVELNIARVELARGNDAEAEVYSERAIERYQRRLKENHPMILEADGLLSRARGHTRSPSDQLAALGASFSRAEHVFGADHRISIELLEATRRAAELSGDDHTARELGVTLDSLRARRKARVTQ